jgi:radical SAM protein with 4Fe4S-binding SPASM domain
MHPSCSAQSVLSNHARLPDLVDFWFGLNQKIFKAVVQMPSPFTKKPSDEKQWLARQRCYLSDLETWAMKLASTLDLERFFLDYHGPVDLFILWERLFWNRRTEPCCGAGEGTLAVDTSGNLYPCEAFIGRPKWQVGDIYGGILENKLKAFLNEKYSAIDHCSGCSVNVYCERCCFGRDPDQSIVDNFLEGCWFSKRLVDIAERSYEAMTAQAKKRAGITGA